MPGAIASPGGTGSIPAAGVQNNLNPSPNVAPSANAVLNGLAQKASQTAFAALSATVGNKADQSAVADLADDIGQLASMASLTALIARVTALENAASAPPSVPSETLSVGSTVYFPLAAGVLGTIYVQRNGVDIPGAVSAPNSNSYAYVITADDDQQSLTIRVPSNSITYDTALPRRFSTQIKDDARDTIEIVYDKTMQLTSINLAHFALSGLLASKTLVSATVVNNVLKLVYDTPFAFSDAPKLTLIADGSNDFCDYAGNLAPTFTNLVVANNINQAAVPISLFSINGGDYGFVIQNGNVVDGPSADHAFMVAALINTDNVADYLYGDGWFEFQCPDVSDVQRHVTLNPDRDNRNQYQHKYELIFFSGGVLAATYAESTGFTAFETHTFSSGSTPTNRWARLRRFQGVVTAEFSEDNKATWTVLHAFANDEVDPLYPRFAILQAGSVLNKPSLAGFVPEGTVET